MLIGLTEQGVNPEALAAVVKELRREAAAIEAEQDPAEALSRLRQRPPTAGERTEMEARAFEPSRK